MRLIDVCRGWARGWHCRPSEKERRRYLWRVEVRLHGRAWWLDQAAAVKAILTDSKVSDGLYNALGVDVKKLKKTITQEISRGIASSLPYRDIARNINNVSGTGLYNAKRIARTEGHRIQQTSTRDAQYAAKEMVENSVNSGTIILTRYSEYSRIIRYVDAVEDAKNVNPNYSKQTYEYTNNCQWCVSARELRQRVFLVEQYLDKVIKNPYEWLE